MYYTLLQIIAHIKKATQVSRLQFIINTIHSYRTVIISSLDGDDVVVENVLVHNLR